MSLNALQDIINTAADARLRGRVDEKIDSLRQDAARITGPIRFQASEVGQSVQMVTVEVSAVDLVNILADAAFQQRRDQARNKATRDFLDKVAAAGIEP